MRLVEQQRRTIAVRKTRPCQVPEDAWWDQRRGQWMLGRLDDEGLPQGMWTFWDADGTLAERSEYAQGRRNGPAWCCMTPGMFVGGEVVAARGRFEDDIPRGRWFLLDARGVVIEEFDYGPALRGPGKGLFQQPATGSSRPSRPADCRGVCDRPEPAAR